MDRDVNMDRDISMDRELQFVYNLMYICFQEQCYNKIMIQYELAGC